jgi:hypothetical protein
VTVHPGDVSIYVSGSEEGFTQEGPLEFP